MNLNWDELIPHVAHDIRALVRKGITNAQLLERLLGASANEDVSRHLQAIIQSQTDINKLLVRLVILSDAAGAEPNNDVMDLEAVILGSKLECRDALQQQGAELIVGQLPDALVPKRVQTIFTELIGNSLRYAEPSRAPRITIEADAEGEKLRVKVRDNGSGIPTDCVDLLFQPMQRLDSRSGVGFGLAIAKAIAESAKGNIHHEPEAVGTCFVLELPAPAI